MSNTKQLAVLRRRENLLELMLDGICHQDILKFYKEQYPSMSHKTVETDITWVYDQLETYVETNSKRIINHHLIQYDKNLQLARDTGQIAAANQALKLKEELLGLRTKIDKQVNVQVNNNTVNVIPMENYTYDQLLKIIESDKEADS